MTKGVTSDLITTGTKRSFYKEESARAFAEEVAAAGYRCTVLRGGEEGAAWVVTVLNPALPDQDKYKSA